MLIYLIQKISNTNIPYFPKLILLILLELTYNIYKKIFPPSRINLNKKYKNCFITGGTKGIGKEILAELKNKYNVFSVGRSFNNDFVLDLNDFVQVSRFECDIVFDLVIFNAGIMTDQFENISDFNSKNNSNSNKSYHSINSYDSDKKYIPYDNLVKETKNNNLFNKHTSNYSHTNSNLNYKFLDKNFKLNFLSHYLLLKKLKLKKNTKIIITSSCLSLTVQNYDLKNKNNFFNKKYSESKFCLLIFAKILSKFYQIIILHPGIYNTNLFDESIFNKILISFLNLFLPDIRNVKFIFYRAIEMNCQFGFLFMNDLIEIPRIIDDKMCDKLILDSEYLLSKLIKSF